MKKRIEEPTVKAGRHNSQDYAHPAYACIRASRVTGSQVLFGSDFVHQHFVRVEIVPATLTRNLSQDWIHGGVQQYIEVDLSEAQWATFVSTLNSGSGTPCTLQYRKPGGEGQVPGLPEPKSRKDQFDREMGEHLQKPIERLRGLKDRLNDMKLSAKIRDEIAMAIGLAVQDIEANIPFVAAQFGEHMETGIERAKIEVEAYVQGSIQRAGLTALTGAVDVVGRLGDGTICEETD